MFFKQTSNKVVSALLISAALTGCFGQKSEEEYLAMAKDSIKNGEVSTAIISLKNVLTVNGKSAEGRFLLGQAYINSGLWISAEKELELALEYGFDKSLVIPLLAKAYYHLGDVKGVEYLITSQGDLSQETQTALKTFIAITFIKEEYNDQGLNYLHEVVERNFESKYTELSKAWQLGVNGELDEALAVINETLSSTPDFIEAIEYKAYLLFKKQDMKMSAEYFGKYVAIHPQAHELRMMYALALVYAEDYQASEKQVDILLQGMPNSAKLNEIKAQNRFAAEDFKKAKQFAETAIRTNPNLVLAKIIAGISAYQLKQLELAYSHLNSVKDNLTFQHPARKLLNKMRLEMGYENDVYQELLTTSDETLDVGTLSLSATELFKLGKVDEANALLNIASQKEEDNANIHYQQGLFKFYNDDPSAKDFFEKAVEHDPEFESAITLLLLESLREKNFSKAFSVAEKVEKKNPELSWIYKSVIYTRKGELNNAKDALNEALKVNGNNPSVYFKLGQISELENKNKEAIQFYQKSIDVDETYTLSASALLKLAKTNVNEVRQVLEALVENKESSPVAYTYLAAYHIVHNAYKDAESVLDDGLAKTPDNVKLLMLKGKVYANSSAYDKALATFDKLVVLLPESSMVESARASVLQRLGRVADAVEAQKSALSKEPNSKEVALGLVDLHIKNRDISAATVVLENINESPKYADEMDYYKGKIAYLKNDYRKASKILNSVFEKIKTEEVTILLSDSLSQNKRFDEALSVIEAFEKNIRPGGTLNTQLKYAEILENTDKDKALDVYNGILEKSNRHFVMLNNIAMIYLKFNKVEEAVNFAKEAYEKTENNLPVQDTYALTLLAAEQYSKAESLLKEIVEQKRDNDNYNLHYASALFSLNKVEEAKMLLFSLDKDKLSEYSLIMYKTLTDKMN